MTQKPIRPDLPVLSDDDLQDEFLSALQKLGSPWQAPSGRSYRIEAEGRQATIFLETPALTPPPSGDDIDRDLLELVSAVHEAVGGGWSALAVRNVARLWGWTP